MTFPDKLRWPLFTLSDRVLVAVSGGPDSLCLLHVLWAARAARGLGAVEAAHLDHGLRGEEAAAEAKWVSAWCEERGIPCHVGLADVAGLAAERKTSKQEAARAARYQFLAAVAAEIGADKVATAHTQDDQVETVLMNVLRGTGLDGLRGIPARRGLYVRPLLDVSRAEIEDYCAAHGLEPRRDPSNLSPDNYTRNRVRLELLPMLARDYNPAVADALLRLSEIAGRDLDYLQTQADAALAAVIVSADQERQVLDHTALRRLHPALLRRVLRTAIANLRGTVAGITHHHIEVLAEVIERYRLGTFGMMIPAPFCRIQINPTIAPTVVLMLNSHPLPPHDLPHDLFAFPLQVPGEVLLPELGWRIKASLEEGDFEEGKASDDYRVVLDADALDFASLVVRTWQSGDKIAPSGMNGHHKKVGNLFTDAKVPHAERRRTLIILDAQGIVWVVGHCLAERVKVTPDTRRRLFLTAHLADEAGYGPDGGE